LSDRARAVISSLDDLRTSNAVRQFVIDFNELYGDVDFANDASIWAIEKINEALPYGYRTFVKTWKGHTNGMSITGGIFRIYRSHLLGHVEENEARVKKKRVRKSSA
jgi:hypothetical protein